MIGCVLASGLVWASLYGAFIYLGILSAFDGILPLFVDPQIWQEFHGALASFFLASCFTWLSDRIGPRLVVALFGFVTATPFSCLARTCQSQQH